MREASRHGKRARGDDGRRARGDSQMDRAPLVEIATTDRRSPPAAPDRELPLRLPGIA
jgi:hypothetical protein